MMTMIISDRHCVCVCVCVHGVSNDNENGIDIDNRRQGFGPETVTMTRKKRWIAPKC